MRLDTTNKSRSLAGNSDLTLFAPIKPGFVDALESVTFKTRIRRLLQTLNGGRSTSLEYALLRPSSDAVERVGRIHSVRVLILEPENKVMLAATFEGTWEAYFRVLWQKVPTLLDIIFCDTVGYVTAADHRFDEWEAWARSVQVETQFFYAMPRLTVDDVRHLRHDEQERQRCPAGPETELAALRHKLDSVEAQAWDTAANTSGAASFEAIRQGMESLAALYRLTDLYPPTTPDGTLLQRAARHLLLEFVTLRERDEIPPQLLALATSRFARQLDWLLQPPTPAGDAERLAPDLIGSAPSFDRSDVQGGIVTAYAEATHGCLLLLAVRDPVKARVFFDELLPRITPEGGFDPKASAPLALNLAFTCEGLRAMGLQDSELAAFPLEFREGMEARASMLGDARSNHPRRWKPPLAHGLPAGQPTAQGEPLRIELSAVHLVLQLRTRAAKDSPWAEPAQAAHPLHAAFEHWRQRAEACELQLLAVQAMQRQFNAQGKIVEHFGYADGDSNSDPLIEPQTGSRVYPNQVALGEILLGYANQADDAPRAAAAASVAVDLDIHLKLRREWLHNGSFLVVRKLAQDVAAFESAVASAAGKAGLPTDLLRAKMMGRWDDGKPLVKADLDDNDFDFSGDPQGRVCPFHAHIRRANPRQSEAGINELPGRRTPRIVRRGMSYGPRYEGPANADAERGMVFMAYNASIGEQFEVVQGWLSGGNSSGSYSSPSDPLLGVPENGQQRHFRFEADSAAGKPRVFSVALDGSDEAMGARRPFVQLQWGAYLFAPSMRVLKLLAARLAGRGAAPLPVWSVDEGEKLVEALLALEARLGQPGKQAAIDAWKAALEDPVEQESFRSASIWAAIRKRPGGVLRTAYGVLLASEQRVLQAFAANSELSVCGYHRRLAGSIGEIYLSLDAGPDYQRLSKATNDAIEAIKTDEAYALAHLITQGVLQDNFLKQARAVAINPMAPTRWELTLDLKELIDPVLGRICQQWFGLPLKTPDIELGGWRWEARPTKAYYPGSFTPPSRHAFQPNPGATVRQVGLDVGAACTAAFTRFVGTAEADSLQQGRVSKAIVAAFNAAPDRDALIARTLVGAMMGFLPTTDGNLRRVLNEWLRDGSFWSLRAAWLARPPAARLSVADAEEIFGAPLRQAMQLRPSPELVWRTAACDAPIGLADVKQGDKLVLSIVSATQQHLVQGLGGDPGVSPIFGGQREPGGPTHACPGYEAAMGVLLGFVAALMDTTDAMRASAVPLALVFEGPLPIPDVTPDPPPGGPTPPTPAPSHPAGVDGVAQQMAGDWVLGLGDSWFHYFAADVFDVLRYGMKLKARSFAQEGTELLALQARPDQLAQLAGFIQQQRLQYSQRPGVVLLSAGGNDVVHPRLAELLHPRQPQAGADEAVAGAINAITTEAHVDGAMGAALYATVRAIADISQQHLGHTVPIILHGYDYPTPDGRGPLGSAFGNWLQPSFKQRGYTSVDEGARIMRSLIDRLNAMQIRVCDALRLEGLDVRHVDLRGMLQPQAGWQNELHPSVAGFRLLADKLAAEVRACLAAPLATPAPAPAPAPGSAARA